MLVFCVPLNIYSIISLTKNAYEIKKNSQKLKHEDFDIHIKKLSTKMKFLLAFITIVTISVCYVFLRFVFRQQVSIVTSACVLGFMIIYKILNVARFKESWVFGIIQSGLSLILWMITIVSGLSSILKLLMIMLCIANLSNNIYGYFKWKLMYRKTNINGGIILNSKKISI